MTEREALKLALDFIERVNKDGWILADFEPQMYAVINAIKEALAQPEEPVFTYEQVKAHIRAAMMSTTPPQRTWVGLTNNEIALINADYPNPQGFARALEAKIKEKNT